MDKPQDSKLDSGNFNLPKNIDPESKDIILRVSHDSFPKLAATLPDIDNPLIYYYVEGVYCKALDFRELFNQWVKEPNSLNIYELISRQTVVIYPSEEIGRIKLDFPPAPGNRPDIIKSNDRFIQWTYKHPIKGNQERNYTFTQDRNPMIEFESRASMQKDIAANTMLVLMLLKDKSISVDDLLAESREIVVNGKKTVLKLEILNETLEDLLFNKEFLNTLVNEGIFEEDYYSLFARMLELKKQIALVHASRSTGEVQVLSYFPFGDTQKFNSIDEILIEEIIYTLLEYLLELPAYIQEGRYMDLGKFQSLIHTVQGRLEEGKPGFYEKFIIDFIKRKLRFFGIKFDEEEDTKILLGKLRQAEPETAQSIQDSVQDFIGFYLPTFAAINNLYSKNLYLVDKRNKKRKIDPSGTVELFGLTENLRSHGVRVRNSHRYQTMKRFGAGEP